MILADSINLPLVAGLGLITFGPLTLLVTLIEGATFRYILGVRVRSSFRPILIANLLSTLAGGILLMFQDVIIFGSGITESIPSFVHGYRWIGPLLIVGYLAKSLLVEGLWLTRRAALAALARPRPEVLRGVLLGNVLSYLVVGPLFYVTTRPHFGGIETTFDARWTANADEVIYFIDRKDHTVKRSLLRGGKVETLVPFPVWSFLVSDDESTIAYVATDGALDVYRAGQPGAIRVSEPKRVNFLTSVSLSPDNQSIAFVESPKGDWPYPEDAQSKLKIRPIAKESEVEIASLPASAWDTPIAWSRDGQFIYALLHVQQKRQFWKIRAREPSGAREECAVAPAPSEFVVNYGRFQRRTAFVGGRPMIQFPEQFSAGPFSVEVYPWLGSFVRIDKGSERVLFLQNEYGLLNLSMPPFQSAMFLPKGDELLIETWGQTYLLGIDERRMGLVADGDQFVLRTSSFCKEFDSSDE